MASSSTSLQSNKFTQLSHEELLLPLIYWTSVPQHIITAMLVHKSLRFGELLITGSSTGEFIIWRGASYLNEDDDDDEHIDINEDIEWIAIAMSFSTNTTSIKCIIGLTSYRDETAFVALHSDGEMVIFSIEGSGALNITLSETAILPNTAVSTLVGHKKINERYKYLLCTEFDANCIHFIDLKNRGKQIGKFALSKNDNSTIIDLCLFSDQNVFACIDNEAKIGIFEFAINQKANNEIKPIQPMDFNSRLR